MLITRRRGFSAAELLVALVLGGIVVSMLTGTLVAQRRAERTGVAVATRGMGADDVVSVMTAILSRLSRDDTLVVRGDTAIDVKLVAGIALPCAAASDSLVLPAGSSAAWWDSAPDSGDVAELAYADLWRISQIVGVRTRIAVSGPCAGAHHVLTIASVPGEAGLPLVRVTRRARFMVYRGSDGAWWFGERSCDASEPPHCGAAQPIAGPMAGAAAIRFSIDSTHADPAVHVQASAAGATREAVVVLRQ